MTPPYVVHLFGSLSLALFCCWLKRYTKYGARMIDAAISPREKNRAERWPSSEAVGPPPISRMVRVITTIAALTPMAAPICWAMVNRPAAMPCRPDSTPAVPAMFRDTKEKTRSRAVRK